MNASAAAVVSIVPHVFREGAEVAKAPKTELIGRDAELKRLSTFVDGSPRGPAFVLVEGEAGIGKSTLWEWAVGQAREHGRLVLTSRPNSNDIALAYAALGDLLDETLDEALEQLPAPQRRALGAALLLTDADGAAPDPRATGLSVLGVLRALSAAAPVLVAVDDAQWVDRSSATVLEFALRRLRSEPVAVLAARRAGLAGGLGLPDAELVTVGRMSLGAHTGS